MIPFTRKSQLPRLHCMKRRLVQCLNSRLRACGAARPSLGPGRLPGSSDLRRCGTAGAARFFRAIMVTAPGCTVDGMSLEHRWYAFPRFARRCARQGQGLSTGALQRVRIDLAAALLCYWCGVAAVRTSTCSASDRTAPPISLPCPWDGMLTSALPLRMLPSLQHAQVPP